MNGNELLLMRRNAKVTQSELASAIGYSRQAIVKWERGIHDIPSKIVPAILAACAKAPKSEPTKAERELARETLEAYRKMRKDFDHAFIIKMWSESNFTPSMEAQAAIVEAFPDILEQANG